MENLAKFIQENVLKIHNLEVLKEEKKQIVEKLKMLNESSLLTEDSLDDFFNFLEKNPKGGSISWAYYTYPVSLNKNMIENGQKVLNPMYGKIFKNIAYQFNFGEVYSNAAKKTNPDYIPGQRSGNYEKIQGFKVTEMGKSGLYLPIIPKRQESAYSVNEGESWKNVTFEEIQKYFPDRKPFTPSTIEYKQLIVDRIARIVAGGHDWTNPHFAYKYMGPQPKGL